MTDQTPLRDRIAAALYDHSHPGWAISFPDLDQEQRDTYLARADAVLAVLPAPADRRAVLREAADRIDRTDLPQDDVDCFDNGARWATKLLRRVADETAATETQARDCPACDAGIGHSEHCPTPETHKWGCGCHAETQPPAALSPAERTMLDYALNQAQERIWADDGFTDEDQAAVDSLRRLTTVQRAAGARQAGAQR
ncbi:hypothetical protein [Streptomyces coelicoflavus]|uniref:hypothetical protein n=1 Tax=Streptomyces coelicoflavus TaxID=285562 RepID=UPI00363AC177